MQLDRLKRHGLIALFAGVIVALPFAALSIEAKALNIVAIGASNTAGWGVGSQNAFPAILQARLRKKGINANVINAGIPGDVTAGMLDRLGATVPAGTDIVILQPGSNDLRFFGTKERRAANIEAIVGRLHGRGIRVIIYDPGEMPADFYQWDGIHFNAATHARIAATLAAQIAATQSAHPSPPGHGAPAN